MLEVFPRVGVVVRTEIKFFDPEDVAAVVVGVEVHVECVDDAVAFIVDDDGGRDGVVGFPTAVGLGAFEPGWVFGYVVFGGEPDIVSELVDVVEGQWIGS